MTPTERLQATVLRDVFMLHPPLGLQYVETVVHDAVTCAHRSVSDVLSQHRAWQHVPRVLATMPALMHQVWRSPDTGFRLRV